MKLLPKLLLLTSMAVAAVGSSQPITVTVDGLDVNFPDVQPTMVHGRVLVPLRGVFEQIGAYVDWNEAAQTVSAMHGARDVKLTLGSYRAIVDGQPVTLDTPAMMMHGRTMVPLRFLSESLNAEVNWIALSHVVEISTLESDSIPPPPAKAFRWLMVPTASVIPFRLTQRLSSETAMKGDRFTGTLETSGSSDYQGLPRGTIVRGHVSDVKAMHGQTPGVLGLAFDEIKLPDGSTYAVDGALIGLDAGSVTNQDGRLVAKSNKRKDSLKYVGYGAGAGVILSVLTKGNALTDALIGGALGFLYGESQKDSAKVQDVELAAGSKFGVRLKENLSFKVPENGS